MSTSQRVRERHFMADTKGFPTSFRNRLFWASHRYSSRGIGVWLGSHHVTNNIRQRYFARRRPWIWLVTIGARPWRRDRLQSLSPPARNHQGRILFISAILYGIVSRPRRRALLHFSADPDELRRHHRHDLGRLPAPSCS